MARVIIDDDRKTVLAPGIMGKDWRNNTVYDAFTQFFEQSTLTSTANR